MRYLLDTCVFSEYKKRKPEQRVIDWLDSQSDDLLCLSVLTIGELEKGIARMPASQRRADLQNFVEELLIRFDQRILTIDARIVRRWGRMVANLEAEGRPMPLIDSLIAATALENDLTIVTRNEADFEYSGARLINPWD